MRHKKSATTEKARLRRMRGVTKMAAILLESP